VDIVTTSTTELTATIAGLPSASLSVSSGITPRARTSCRAAALENLAPSSFYGVLAVYSQQSINQLASIPVT
jgi:hypothetical protein